MDMDTQNIQSVITSIESVIRYKFVHKLAVQFGVHEHLLRHVYDDLDLGKFAKMLTSAYWNAIASKKLPADIANLWASYLYEKKQKLKTLLPQLMREYDPKERFKKTYKTLIEI